MGIHDEGDRKQKRRESTRRLWEQRFLVYLQLGPERTLAQAWRACCHVPAGVSDAELPAIWQTMARRQRWEACAEAHDRGAGVIVAWDVSEPEISAHEREQRKQNSVLLLMQHTLMALGAARLDTLSTDEARALLPTSRLLLVALNNILMADRTASSLPDAHTAPEGEFSAALWAAALQKARGRVQEDEAQKQAVSPSTAARVPTLLVCIGNDPALMVDLAMLRAVKRETGLHFHRIRNATRTAIEDHLRRERELGRPVRYLHLACHGGSQGILLADGMVGGEWLSTHLQGVEVLLLGACKGEMVGDWLAVVPWVVTFADALGHKDAAVVTRAFWTAIANGRSPEDALQVALEAAPPHVSEFVVKHWKE